MPRGPKKTEEKSSEFKLPPIRGARPIDEPAPKPSSSNQGNVKLPEIKSAAPKEPKPREANQNVKLPKIKGAQPLEIEVDPIEQEEQNENVSRNSRSSSVASYVVEEELYAEEFDESDVEEVNLGNDEEPLMPEPIEIQTVYQVEQKFGREVHDELHEEVDDEIQIEYGSPRARAISEISLPQELALKSELLNTPRKQLIDACAQYKNILDEQINILNPGGSSKKLLSGVLGNENALMRDISISAMHLSNQLNHFIHLLTVKGKGFTDEKYIDQFKQNFQAEKTALEKTKVGARFGLTLPFPQPKNTGTVTYDALPLKKAQEQFVNTIFNIEPSLKLAEAKVAKKALSSTAQMAVLGTANVQKNTGMENTQPNELKEMAQSAASNIMDIHQRIEALTNKSSLQQNATPIEVNSHRKKAGK